MSWPNKRLKRRKIVQIAVKIRRDSQKLCLIFKDFSLRKSNMCPIA